MIYYMIMLGVHLTFERNSLVESSCLPPSASMCSKDAVDGTTVRLDLEGAPKRVVHCRCQMISNVDVTLVIQQVNKNWSPEKDIMMIGDFRLTNNDVAQELHFEGNEHTLLSLTRNTNITSSRICITIATRDRQSVLHVKCLGTEEVPEQTTIVPYIEDNLSDSVFPTGKVVGAISAGVIVILLVTSITVLIYKRQKYAEGARPESQLRADLVLAYDTADVDSVRYAEPDTSAGREVTIDNVTRGRTYDTVHHGFDVHQLAQNQFCCSKSNTNIARNIDVYGYDHVNLGNVLTTPAESTYDVAKY